MTKLTSIKPITKITYISQPNSITNSKQDLNLLEQRIMLGIIKELQKTMQDLYFKKTTLEQLLLFDDVHQQKRLNLNIKLSSIYNDNRKYKEVRNALKIIAATPMEINYINADGKERVRLTHLFDIEFNKGKYITNFDLSINSLFADHLLNLNNGGFTKFGYEVAINSSNKYLPKFYTWLSSWKSKGGTKIQLHKLADLLSVSKSNYVYKSFNRYILKPAHVYLKEDGDIYFEYSHENGLLSFKIIDRNSKRLELVLAKHREILTRLGLNEKEIDILFQYAYTNFDSWNTALTNIILHINNTDTVINSPYNYIKKGLETALKNKLTD